MTKKPPIPLTKADKVELLKAVQLGAIAPDICARLAGQPDKERRNEDMKESEITAELHRLGAIESDHLNAAAKDVLTTDLVRKLFDRLEYYYNTELHALQEKERREEEANRPHEPPTTSNDTARSPDCSDT